MSNALNFDSFMNPMKGNAAFSIKTQLQAYKELYLTKISKELLVSCVYNKRYDRWMFFFKYPSENNEKYPSNIFYDIMIEFDPQRKSDAAAATLNTYDIYVYSNSPSFVFTFDYVMKQQVGFPKSLPKSYLSKIAITKPPKIRNTFQILTAEKTTWICFYHLYRNGYLNKDIAKQLISDKTKTEDFYIKNMQTQPEKLQEIKSMQDLIKNENKAKKENDKSKTIKTYRKDEDKEKSPLHTSILNTSSFKSGIRRINPFSFLSKLIAKNLKTKDLYKSDTLKSNLGGNDYE